MPPLGPHATLGPLGLRGMWPSGRHLFPYSSVRGAILSQSLLANLHPSSGAAREEHAAAGEAAGRHRDGAEGQRVQVDLPQEHGLGEEGNSVR